MKIRVTCTLLAATICLCACNGNGTAPDNDRSTLSSTPAIATADDVVKGLAASGLHITDIQIVTPETDGHGLLGKPGGYASKVFFYDARHPKQAGSHEGENTIEMFATSDAAEARETYLVDAMKAVPDAAQSMVRSGRVLARFDRALRPEEVKEYENTLADIAPD